MFGHKAGAFTGAIRGHERTFWRSRQRNNLSGWNRWNESAYYRQTFTRDWKRRISKVGDSKSTKVNVRTIAATNRNLQKEIEAGNFRKDYSIGLSVFRIQLPPFTRQSGWYVPRVYFCEFVLCKDEQNHHRKELSKNFIEALMQYSGNGNIRELKNIIERSVILSDRWTNFRIHTSEFQPFSSEKRSKTPFTFSASAEKLHIQKY